MHKNHLELANTVAMNGAVLPHFRKTDSIMYLPMMKNVREKMRRLNLFDTTESFEAFTLAETLITLTILGVVAAITVPMLINKQMESANRTKVKKAMATYEKALNQMIIENDLKDSAAIQAFGATVNGVACGNTRPYFKSIENGGTNCRFKTADRVWWDITDIQHPIIMLNDDNKEIELTGERGLQAKAKGDDKTVYGMVGTINNGIVRINDKGVATGDDATLLNKTYAFMNNESANGDTSIKYTYTPINSQYADACTDDACNWGMGGPNCKNCTYYRKDSEDENIVAGYYTYDNNGTNIEFGVCDTYGCGKYDPIDWFVVEVGNDLVEKCNVVNNSHYDNYNNFINGADICKSRGYLNCNDSYCVK